MKTAIYIEDGVVQLVITPENQFENNVLAMFADKPFEAKLFQGSFYDSRGGWVRQNDYFPDPIGPTNRYKDRSLILHVNSGPREEGHGQADDLPGNSGHPGDH